MNHWKQKVYVYLLLKVSTHGTEEGTHLGNKKLLKVALLETQLNVVWMNTWIPTFLTKEYSSCFLMQCFYPLHCNCASMSQFLIASCVN